MDAKPNFLLGAGRIAERVFGTDTPGNRRRIYYWHELGVLPTFMTGGQLTIIPDRLEEHFLTLEAEAREEQRRKREEKRA
jgi:hypothetical protein